MRWSVNIRRLKQSDVFMWLGVRDAFGSEGMLKANSVGGVVISESTAKVASLGQQNELIVCQSSIRPLPQETRL